MEKIRIEVDKVILYYMDRVDPDGNLYRFYVYKGMASEIEYFCTEEAGNMTIPIGEGKYVKIVPKEIKKIPVRGYRKIVWKETGDDKRATIKLSLSINDDDNDDVFYYCNGIESFKQLAEYGMGEFIVTFCWSFF